MSENNKRRVRIEWDGESRDSVKLVDDPNGHFVVYDGDMPDIRWKPKTEVEMLTESADAGTLPLGEDPAIIERWSRWNRGMMIPGNAGFFFDGELIMPVQILILDYQFFDETRNHSCPLRMVVEGALYNIPRPTVPPSDDDTFFIPVTEI